MASVGTRNAEAIALFTCEKRLANDFFAQRIYEVQYTLGLLRRKQAAGEADQPHMTNCVSS